MRAILVILLVAASGCVESQSTVEIGEGESHDHCYIFCNSEESHVHFDFFPLLVFLGIITVLVIVIAVAAGGKQEQQQQIVIERR